MVKKYVALLLQLMIWSGFTLAEWLSGKDHLLSKVILFIVFSYLAIIIARKIVNSNKETFIVTLTSLFAYGLLHTMLQLFI
ncbi:hypothetical protein ACFFF5_04680 [Lederbergia wuyishanensis]|uniref:Group-specific protein n=1 Tax=Lederbergia wuyishanensis TaxID=1347903 RepID=A0ABU0CZB5_9BACI|nr:hypothetical protein [Lederbergia wuyishanensis]MCJ8006122.1 hypothetical protein [Lederbergia wuyishanensis]MDQ0341491.1 hypothetical protein [Lederbergia wuyishanensis]